MADAVPVSELEKLRDYLYAEDLIFMRGLAKLNKLIAKYGGKMDEGQIDTAPVVRCKDCIHSSDVLYQTYCGYLDCGVYPHFFCAAGKKRCARGVE